MSEPSESIGTGELAHLVGAQHAPSRWLCLLALEGEVDAAAKALTGALVRAGQVQAQRVVAPRRAAAFATLVQETQGALVVHGLDGYSAEDFRHLDGLRSVLQRRDPVVLVLTREATEQINRYAPNLASWIYRYWTLDSAAGVLPDDQKEARLDVLRGKFDRTDLQIIAAAEAGTLRNDPEFAEWLVLLDRGELLEH
jgi:hypothetical protein